MSSPCARCGTPTAPHELTMSLDGNGYVCQPCNLASQAVQQKAGTRKAYVMGAVIVGAFFLIVAARITLRILLSN